MPLEFNDILLYTDANVKVKIEVIYEEDTFWLSEKKMAELFDVGVPTINEPNSPVGYAVRTFGYQIIAKREQSKLTLGLIYRPTLNTAENH